VQNTFREWTRRDADARRPRLRATAAAATLAALVLFPCFASSLSPIVTELTDDGAWCWFSSPAALYRDGTVVTGWVNQCGDIEVASHSVPDSVTSVTILHPGFEPDDHDNPAFYAASDGRLTAFYSKHARMGTYTMYRTSIHSWSTGAWFGISSTGVNTVGYGGATYSNPVAMPGETDRVLLFWRGGNWRPSYSVGTYESSDATWSWTDARTLIAVHTGRPYVRYAPSPDGRIAFAFTNGHPSESDAALRFALLGTTSGDTLAYFRSDGSLIKLASQGALNPEESEMIYDGSETTSDVLVEAWVWDAAVDREGNPVVAFVSFPELTHHRYHWATCRNGEWMSTVLVENAGGTIADTTIGNPQHYYSGGLALDPHDPNTVYVSRENGVSGWDLEQWKTGDQGTTWTVRSITEDSTLENVRPVVPLGRPDGMDMVLWMQGSYHYYKNYGGTGVDYYDTGIMLWVDDPLTGTDGVEVATSLALRPCTPNPTRGVTRITLDLPETTRVDIAVYDVAGRLVNRLLDDHRLERGARTVVWNGTDSTGSRVASGVYFVRASADGQTAAAKVLVLR